MKVQKILLLLLLCIGVSNFMVWNVLAQIPPTIEIVKPLDRRNVSSTNTEVTVQMDGVSANDGYYWELWVDEEPVVGARNGEQTVTISFKPTGPHRLKAVLFDAQGQQLAVSDVVLVIAAPVQERTPQFNQQLMAPIMAVLTLGTIVLIVASVWLNRRVRASKWAEAENKLP